MLADTKSQVAIVPLAVSKISFLKPSPLPHETSGLVGPTLQKIQDRASQVMRLQQSEQGTESRKANRSELLTYCRSLWGKWGWPCQVAKLLFGLF